MAGGMPVHAAGESGRAVGAPASIRKRVKCGFVGDRELQPGCRRGVDRSPPAGEGISPDASPRFSGWCGSKVNPTVYVERVRTKPLAPIGLSPHAFVSKLAVAAHDAVQCARCAIAFDLLDQCRNDFSRWTGLGCASDHARFREWRRSHERLRIVR